MDIRIGMKNTARELSFETDEAPEDVKKKVASALEVGAPAEFTDIKGNTYLVSGSVLSYIEIGTAETRRVGFVA
ncbi:DUF3107 domain-containing protein [Microbacterium indicum]|uniref:DUF3107 domain-containing protein n=1 Tax=Microbacterium indicum TaxID=358100 RepID=UPI0003F4D3E3|nr:DUF3107 domain-containing protein [Microbacterium indicum]